MVSDSGPCPIVSEDGFCPRCGPDDNETAGRDYLGHPDGGVCLALYRVV